MLKKFIILISFVCIVSCEEQVDVAIENFEERAIIQANFEIFRDSSFSRNRVFIRKTRPFFEETWRNVEDAKVSIKNTQNDSLYIFDYFRNGAYFNSELLLKEDITYELTVEIDEEIYFSTAKSISNSPIESIEYIGDRTRESEEIAEFNVVFTDDITEKNYYLFELDYSIINVFEDNFFNGQAFNFSLFKRKSDIFNNSITVTSYGIDKDYFMYLSKLIELNEPQFYGPFSTPPASPRGNIVNKTNVNNFAFGYFQISVVYDKVYTFAEPNKSKE